eukprot:433271_1
MATIAWCLRNGTNQIRQTSSKRIFSTLPNRNMNNPFVSPFMITILYNNNKNYHFPQNRIWLNSMNQFCSRQQNEDNESGHTGYYDTPDLQPSKINDINPIKKKRSMKELITEYGLPFLGVYCFFWFGMYGVFYTTIHWKFIDITDIANYIPFGKERINNALSHHLGEATVALVVTEAAEVIRLPLVIGIFAWFKKYRNKTNK